MAEVNTVSRCCEASVRMVDGLTAVGVARVPICVSCGERCATMRQWNGLPPVGTFEKPMRVRHDGQAVYDG